MIKWLMLYHWYDHVMDWEIIVNTIRSCLNNTSNELRVWYAIDSAKLLKIMTVCVIKLAGKTSSAEKRTIKNILDTKFTGCGEKPGSLQPIKRQLLNARFYNHKHLGWPVRYHKKSLWIVIAGDSANSVKYLKRLSISGLSRAMQIWN